MFKLLLGLLVVPWHGIFGHSLSMSGSMSSSMSSSMSGKKSKSMSSTFNDEFGSGYDGYDEWTSTMTSTLTSTEGNIEVVPSLGIVTLATPSISSSTLSTATSTSSSIFETDKESDLNSLESVLETDSQSSSKVPLGIGLGVGIGLLFVGVAMVVKRRGNLRDERERSQTLPPVDFATDRTGSVLSHDGYLVPSRQTSISTDGVVDSSNTNSIYSQYIIYDQALKMHNANANANTYAYAEATQFEDPEYELGNNQGGPEVPEGNVLYETAQPFEEASYDLASSLVEDQNNYYLAVGNEDDGC